MRLAVLIVVVIATVAQAHAAGVDFDSTIAVAEDGSAVVIEYFESPTPLGSFERRIPVLSHGPLASRRLFVDVIEVTDGEGRALAYTAGASGSMLRIVVPGASRSLKISYGVRNAVRFAADHDELLWVVGGIPQGLSNATVQFLLPEAASARFQFQGFLRRDRPEAPKIAEWSSEGGVPFYLARNRLRAGAPGPLAPGVSMVLDVFFDKDVLHGPGALTRAWWFSRTNPVVLLPLAALAAMLLLRRAKPADANAGRSIAPMYAPPDGLSPAEAGVLLDDHLDPRDLTATLVDLAVRGYVQIEEVTAGEHGPHTDYIFRLLKPMPQWPELKPHERTMLFHTFYGGHWTMLSSLRLRFYALVPLLREEVMQLLKAKGYYRVAPEQAATFRLAVVTALMALLTLGAWTGWIPVSTSPALAAAMAAATIAIVSLLGRKMTAKTLRGMRTYVALLGLQEFISTVERDHLQRMSAESFEKLLPYAMAMGIEQRWAQAIAGIATEPPPWYRFAENWGFDSRTFGRHIDALSEGTLATMIGPPRAMRPGLAAPPPLAPEAVESAHTGA